MADSAAATDAAAVECGFCMQKDEVLVNPKTLPCLHVHCLRCLTDYYDRYKMLECPFCSEVYEITPDSLPAADIREDNSPLCDVCLKKGVSNEQAVVYCKTCTKKYCLKHQEAHDDLHEDHPVISIDDYKVQERKLQIRHCTEHKDQVYTLGCKLCLRAFCLLSLSSPDLCAQDMTHQFVSLDELLKELKKTIVDLQLSDKEARMSQFFKLISKVVSDYDVATEEMTKTLHKTRDEQLLAIRLKYDLLETELIEQRKKSKSAITEFMEEDVGKQLFRLSNYRLRIEARLQHSHEVDMLKGFRDVKQEVAKLVDAEMPVLDLQNVVVLDSTDVLNRNIELEVNTRYGHIDLEQGLTTSVPIPKSVKHLKTIALSSPSTAVCYYKGNTYVGMNNGKIDNINENYQLNESFITINGPVEGLTVYKDEIYSLMYGEPYVVNVHDLSGQQLRTWNHTDSATRHNNFAIVADQMVIPDRLNQRLVLYSLTGEVLKYVPCEFSNGTISICAAGNNAVIISEYNNSKVFRVDISTGSVIWTVQHVTNPQGIARYGRNHVVVVGRNNTSIWFIDANTGELVSEVKDDSRIPGSVRNLDICGETMILPCSGNYYDNCRVIFYKLEIPKK